jgi:hypothetical protein
VRGVGLRDVGAMNAGWPGLFAESDPNGGLYDVGPRCLRLRTSQLCESALSRLARDASRTVDLVTRVVWGSPSIMCGRSDQRATPDKLDRIADHRRPGSAEVLNHLPDGAFRPSPPGIPKESAEVDTQALEMHANAGVTPEGCLKCPYAPGIPAAPANRPASSAPLRRSCRSFIVGMNRLTPIGAE